MPTALGAVVLGAGQVVAVLVLFAATAETLGVLDAVALLLADLVILGIILAFARRGTDRLSPTTLGIRRTRPGPAIGWTLAILVGILGFEGIWVAAVGDTGIAGIAGIAGTEGSEPASVTAVLLLFLGIAVATPIAEEVALRGYLFPALTRWRGPWIAAVISSVLFGLAHFAVYPLEILPPLMVVGFGCCLLLWFTGSLLPCVALHAINNALVLGLSAGWSWQVPLVVAGSVLIALLVLAPFARRGAPDLDLPTSTVEGALA